MSSQATRIEHDLLGEKEVAAHAYYGVQTARGLENFHRDKNGWTAWLWAFSAGHADVVKLLKARGAGY